MPSRLDLLARNLVGVNGMMCKKCEMKQNLPTLMRTMLLMECVGSVGCYNIIYVCSYHLGINHFGIT